MVAPRRRQEVAEPLTERELAVLRLLSTRLSNREIGGQLYVSVNTIRTHLQAIYRKLGVATRAEAVATSTRARPAPWAGASQPGWLRPPAATSSSWPGRCGWPAT